MPCNRVNTDETRVEPVQQGTLPTFSIAEHVTPRWQHCKSNPWELTFSNLLLYAHSI
jgi:hypothetical protein